LVVVHQVDPAQLGMLVVLVEVRVLAAVLLV
jgi:hypothetical protein